jgi:hypothetical protein
MAKKAKEALRWQGRNILKQEDGFELDRNAAVYEFKHKLERKKAEDMAYGDYRKGQSLDGAAYHLAGMKAAHAVGNKEDAIKHSLAYGLHMKQLGLDPVSEPPDEIKARVEKHGKVYKFSPHDSDTLFVDKE